MAINVYLPLNKNKYIRIQKKIYLYFKVLVLRSNIFF
jgi:hypothetical protein